MHSQTCGSVFALSCCEYQLQARSLASVASSAPAGPTRSALAAICASRNARNMMDGGASNRRAAGQRLRPPDTGLIKRSKTSGRHLTRPQGKVTLLAASTLAQMASMAALSSRRRAFFSFALLDFLWEIRAENNRIKNTYNDVISTFVCWNTSEHRSLASTQI